MRNFIESARWALFVVLTWAMIVVGAPVVIIGAYAAATATQQYPVFTWQANPGWSSTWPACSSTVTKMCLTGYTIMDTTKATAPFVVSNTIPATALSYTMWTMPGSGKRSYSLVVTGKDQDGNAASSIPVTLTTTIPSAKPGAPLAFTVVP